MDDIRATPEWVHGDADFASDPHMQDNAAMRLAAIALILSCGFGATVHAQDADAAPAAEEIQEADPAREEARLEFEAGTEAAAEGRWADSLSRFEHAYLLSGVPVALFNAAMALRALGRHREARDAFDQLRSEHPQSDASSEAQVLRDEVAARVALIELAGLDPDGPYAIRLDAEPVAVIIARPTIIESDPGPRALVIEREGFESYAWEGTLADGERLNLTVIMEPLPEEGGSVLRSPVFWIVTGLLLAGGAATLGWYFTRESDLQPTHMMNSLVL